MEKLNCFLGIEAYRFDSGFFFLGQIKYATNLLVKTKINEAYSCSSPVVVGTKLCIEDSSLFKDPIEYRTTIEDLQYLTITRLDLSFVVNKLIQFLKFPTQL